MIGLTPLTFGKIGTLLTISISLTRCENTFLDKPSAGNAKEGYISRISGALPFFRGKSDNIRKSQERLKEFTPKQIQRQLPHIASGARPCPLMSRLSD